MNTLVVYDSKYGHTKTVAETIGAALPGVVTVVHASQATASALGDLDLLVVGAPTQSGRPSAATATFLAQLEDRSLQGKRVAAFDTRMRAMWVIIFGFAAPKIAARLEEKGGLLVGKPAALKVKGTRGPLVDGELERATAWAKGLLETQA